MYKISFYLLTSFIINVIFYIYILIIYHKHKRNVSSQTRGGCRERFIGELERHRFKTLCMKILVPRLTILKGRTQWNRFTKYNRFRCCFATIWVREPKTYQMPDLDPNFYPSQMRLSGHWKCPNQFGLK